MNLKLNRSTNWFSLATLTVGFLLCSNGALAEDAESTKNTTSNAPPVFAQVGDTTITQREFDNSYIQATRSRFYHGQPPEAEVAMLQREIGDKLVTNALLLIEAKRQNLQHEEDAVKQKIERYEQQNAKNEQWLKVRERALPVLTKMYVDENLLALLEQKTRTVPQPTENQLMDFYNQNKYKFTEPEQIRVSVLLLSIQPGLPVWDETRKKAEGLVKELREGADFAKYVKLYSGDTETIEQGGDMGYLHGGMMSEKAQQEVDKLKPNDISDPVPLMEGIAIFKLADRKPAKLNSFESVKQRVAELYTIDEGEKSWKSLITRLKKEIPVKTDESRYLPLPKP